jgi:hypothetical protein
VTPPGSPTVGELWWYSDAVSGGGILYIYYNDGTSTQWVPVSPNASVTPSLLLPVIMVVFDSTGAIIKQNNNGTYSVVSITKVAVGNYTLNGNFPANPGIVVMPNASGGTTGWVPYIGGVPTTTTIAGVGSLNSSWAGADAARYTVTIYQ